MRVSPLAASPVATMLAGAAFLAFGLLACVENCPLVSQHVVVVSPDQDLQALVEACITGQPATGETCSPASLRPAAPIRCGCLALCRRLLAIADQFPSYDEIRQCGPDPAPVSAYDGGPSQAGVAKLVITYRPSSCL